MLHQSSSFERSPHPPDDLQPQHAASIPHVRKASSLAQISTGLAPSFSAFRARTSSIPTGTPVKRKPVPNSPRLHPSPRAASSSTSPSSSIREEDKSRPQSLDLPQQLPAQPEIPSPPLTGETQPRIDRKSVESGTSASHSGGIGSVDGLHRQTPNIILQSNRPPQKLPNKPIGGSETSPPSSGNERQKRPGRALGSFFAWKSSSQPTLETESPATSFSDRSQSPLPSLRLVLPMQIDGSGSTARLTPPELDVSKANMPHQQYFDNPETPPLLGDSPSNNAHVEALEKELREISVELAASTNREGQLEDEIDELKGDMPSIAPEYGARRSSDYFSDSGTSSMRYAGDDPEAKLHEQDRLRRKAEQERAQLRAESAMKLQAELRRRRDLEALVASLEKQLQQKREDDDHVQQLEAALEETRRRLREERDTKDKIEDLLSALRAELEIQRTEAENLRAEVGPQLKARLHGLEQDAADTQALVYENTRLQQAIQALKEGRDVNHSRFNSIVEERDVMPSPAGLKGGLFGRSTSVKGRAGEGKERSNSVTADNVKDVEDQRDALHQTLKLLIHRHKKQQREHERAIKKLAKERQTAMDFTPKRTAFHREVKTLKDEVQTLRIRAEDALDQKFQYEKGLSGLKMDLDRAEQETKGLRTMLDEHDIFAPSPQPLKPSSQQPAAVPTAQPLAPSPSSAESSRDAARREAESYRQRARTLQEAGEDSDAERLFDAAKRTDELARSFESQAQANARLRTRLAAAVAAGEHEQLQCTRQIAGMQQRLSGMEAGVLAAQQHAETTLGRHEADARRLAEASSPALQRLRFVTPASSPSPSAVPSPPPPLLLFARSPRRPAGPSLADLGRTRLLERRVGALDAALRDAERDVQGVVRGINAGQYAVAELQGERDAALAQMQRLLAEVGAERERVGDLMG